MTDWTQTAQKFEQTGVIAPEAAPAAAEETDWGAVANSVETGKSPDAAIQEDSAPGLQMPESQQVETEDLGFFGNMKELWTGDKSREFNFKEVPVNIKLTETGPVIPIQDAMSMARDNDLARAEIFTRFVPDAKIEWDANMNPYTDYFGEKMYLNRPGASLGDLSEVINTIPMELAAARWGSGFGKRAAGRLGQAVGAGGSLAGTSVLQDKVAQDTGSTQPTDIERAKIMGAFGFGGEVAGMLFNKFLLKFMNSRRFYNKSTGEFTKRGRAVLEKNGIDPDNVSEAFRSHFNKLMDEAVNPADAVAMAEANTLPRRVKLTKGDISRERAQQAFEKRAERGALGEEAEKTMQAFRADQQEALKGNAEDIQAIVGRTEDNVPTVARAGEGVGKAQAALHKQRAAIHRAMKQAYNEADRLGMRVDVKALKNIYDHVNQTLRSFPRGAVFDEMVAMRRFIKPRRGGARVKNVTIRELEHLRSRLSAISRGSDPVQAQAARKAVSAYDEALKAAVEEGLYTGNINALRMFQKGQATRRIIAKMFDEDRIVSKLLQTDYGPYGRLTVPPEEAANLIFTANALGGKSGSIRALERIKANLLKGGNRAEWDALREEAVWRLFRTAQSGDIGQDLTREFSGRKLATAMDNVFRNQPGLMNVLFTPGEQALLKQLRNVAVRATAPVQGAVNYSGTSYEMAQLAQNIFGPAADIVNKIYKTATRTYRPISAAEGVRKATGGGRGARPTRLERYGVPGGLAAVGASTNQSSQKRLTRRGRRRLQR